MEQGGGGGVQWTGWERERGGKEKGIHVFFKCAKIIRYGSWVWEKDNQTIKMMNGTGR